MCYGVFNHDEAITIAKTAQLQVNPLNGLPEILMRESPVESIRDRRAQENLTAATAPIPELASALDPPAAQDHDGSPARTLATPAAVPWAAYSVEELKSVLGFDQPTAERIAGITTDEGLLELAEQHHGWRHDALLEMIGRTELPDVRARLGMDDVAPQSESAPSDDDSDLVERMKSDAAASSFAYIDGQDELQRVIEGGDFAAWRLFLHPEQQKNVTMRCNGPARLTGGAGTGKTVVLLHRARELAQRYPGSRIVLTTFTRNLSDMLARDLRRLDPSLPIVERIGLPGIAVKGIDAIAESTLRHAGSDIGEAVEKVLGVGSTRIDGRTVNPAAWYAAMESSTAELPEVLMSAAFFEGEYRDVVLANDITTKAEYLKVRRTGRGVSLDRAKRAAVWDVIASYRSSCRVAGTVDFAEAATVAAVWLDQGQGARALADHVLVDEGQDFTAGHWRLLRGLAAQGPDDIYIAEDSHQRIYGQRVTLSRFGIDIRGRSRKLRLNYRTTAQNLQLGMQLLDGGEWIGLDDDREDKVDYRSARSGPEPRICQFTSLTQELDAAADVVKQWRAADRVSPEALAILVRDRSTRDLVVKGLGDRGVTVRPVDREDIKPGEPVAMTMHRSKGTEFANVLLFGVNADAIPGPLRGLDFDDKEKEDALLRERALLYVASTRARDELVISYSGEASRFLPR